MQGYQHFPMAGFHPDTGISGNVLVGGDDAGLVPVRIKDGPAGQVFFLVLIQIVLGVEGGAGEFIGILREWTPVRRTRARRVPRGVKDSK